jgi:ribosome-associated heat shock protein Hsp15
MAVARARGAHALGRCGVVRPGLVRINGARIDTSSRPVRPGDVVTIALDRNVRVLKVIGYAERRGSAETVRALYEDLTPPPAPRQEAIGGEREEGSGRPTKRSVARSTGCRAATNLIRRHKLPVPAPALAMHPP